MTVVNNAAASLQPPQQQATVELFQLLRTGGTTAALENPVKSSITDTNGYFRTNGEAIALQTAGMDPADPNFISLRSFQTALEDGQTQLRGLEQHTDALVHGDTSGSPISGGLNSNLSQAMAALSLQGQMISAGLPSEGTSSSSDPCALIGDFFNSIIGAGQALISQINSVVQSAMAAVTQLINQINTAITAGMAALREAINIAVGEIRAVIGEIRDMIAQELEAFAKWLNLGNLFGLSSFLSGLFNNACIKPILDAVGKPAMMSILAQVQTGSVRAGVAALGPIW